MSSTVSLCVNIQFVTDRFVIDFINTLRSQMPIFIGCSKVGAVNNFCTCFHRDRGVHLRVVVQELGW